MQQETRHRGIRGPAPGLPRRLFCSATRLWFASIKAPDEGGLHASKHRPSLASAIGFKKHRDGNSVFLRRQGGARIALRPRSCRDTLPERFPIKARCRSETRTSFASMGPMTVLSGGTDAKSTVVYLSRRCRRVCGRKRLREPRADEDVAEPKGLGDADRGLRQPALFKPETDHAGKREEPHAKVDVLHRRSARS